MEERRLDQKGKANMSHPQKITNISKMSSLTSHPVQHNATHTRGIVHIVRGRYVFQGGHDLINSHYILRVGEEAEAEAVNFSG